MGGARNYSNILHGSTHSKETRVGAIVSRRNQYQVSNDDNNYDNIAGTTITINHYVQNNKTSPR